MGYSSVMRVESWRAILHRLCLSEMSCQTQVAETTSSLESMNENGRCLFCPLFSSETVTSPAPIIHRARTQSEIPLPICLPFRITMPLCTHGPQSQSILSHVNQEVPMLGLTAEFLLMTLFCSYQGQQVPYLYLASAKNVPTASSDRAG